MSNIPHLYQFSYWNPKINDQMTSTVLCYTSEDGIRTLSKVLGFVPQVSEINGRGEVNLVQYEILQDIFMTHYHRFSEKLIHDQKKEQEERVSDSENLSFPSKDEQSMWKSLKSKYIDRL